MNDELWTIRYKAEQLKAAELLAEACGGEVKVSRIGSPVVECKQSLPGGYTFITAQGWKGHAPIELWHVPIDLAEQVLKLVVRGVRCGEDQVQD